MPGVPFNSLPDDARVWVFGAQQPVLGADADRLLDAVDGFVHGWVAHGQPVVGSCAWHYDQFLLIAADERATGVSGCSIDSLFRTLKELEREIGVTLLESASVWFRDESGRVECATRSEFRGLVQSDEVKATTTVFDNTVTEVGQIRRGEWERPLAESWHSRAFLPRTRA